MATTYTHENFTPSAVPTAFKKDVATLVAKAVDMGWTFMVKADNNATLIAPAPNEDQNIHLSTRRNSGPLRRLNSKIEKYGKQPVTAAPKAKTKTKPVSLDLLGDSVVDWDAAADLNTEQAAPSVVDWDAAAELNVEADAALETQAVEVEALVTDALKEIVSTGPMVCDSGNGKTYESNIATQRNWSDGTIDYVCTKCDFTGVKPRSMASHWKWHVRDDESLRQTPLPGTHEPLSLTGALRAKLDEGIDWTDLDNAATQLATAVMNSGTVKDSVGSIEPTTDSDKVLDQIRALVDNGSTEKIAQLERDVTRLQKVADAAEAEAAAAKSTLATFRDLINESV